MIGHEEKPMFQYLFVFQCVTMEGWTPILYWVSTIKLSFHCLIGKCEVN